MQQLPLASLRQLLVVSVVSLLVVACGQTGPATEPASGSTILARTAAPTATAAAPVAIARPAPTSTASSSAAAPRAAATIIAPTPSAAPLPTVGKAPVGKKIGLAAASLNTAFSVTLRDAAQQAAQQAGVQLLVADAANDAATQADEISNFISQRADIILVDPTDSDALAPSLQNANAAKIPVILLNRAPDAGARASVIAYSARVAGREAAQLLNQAVPSRSKLAMLLGGTDASGTQDHASGFIEALHDPLVNTKGMTLVGQATADDDRDQASSVTHTMLATTPDLAGVFCDNDELALGAVQAIKASGTSTVVVVGIDATPETISAIEAGDMYGAVAPQPDVIGQVGVATAVAILNGTVPPQQVDIPWKLVTRANAAPD